MSQTVALDFDGTLHPYSNGWTGSVPDDEPPIPGSREFIEVLHRRGLKTIIYSCRADHWAGALGIYEWCLKWYGAELTAKLPITHVKPPAIAYVDDRGVNFTPTLPNWDECLDHVWRLTKNVDREPA